MVSLFVLPLLIVLTTAFILRNKEKERTEKTIGGDSLDSHLFETETDVEGAFRWWENNRKRYNIGLVIASTITMVVFFLMEPKALGILPQILIFVFIMIIIANGYYFLGYIIERLSNPSDAPGFRKITFNVLFWFSILVNLMPLILTFVFGL